MRPITYGHTNAKTPADADCYCHRDHYCYCHRHDHARSTPYCDRDQRTAANEHRGDSAHRYGNPHGHHAADSAGDPDNEADLYTYVGADVLTDTDTHGDATPSRYADLYADVHSRPD